MIKALLKKTGYCLLIAYNDSIFRYIFTILAIKTIIFCRILYFGLDAFIANFGALLILTSFSLLLNNISLKFYYLSAINIGTSIIYITQVTYYKYFNDIFSLFNINQAKQLNKVFDSIITRLGFETFFILDIFLIPFFLYKIRNSVARTLPDRLATFCLLLSVGIYCNIGFIANSDFVNSLFSRYVLAYNFGIINYQIHDFISFTANKFTKDTLKSSEVLFVQQQLAQKDNVTNLNNYTGIGKGHNVIAIQVESLQSFVIEKKFNGQEVTPNLNRLINTGIIFRNIFDQTSAGNSSDAMFLSNCSLYPAAKGTIAFHYSQNTFDSLAKILSEQGYTTMVLHAYYKDFWNFEALDKSLGFQQRHYQDDYTIDNVIGWGLSDFSFFSQSLNKIKTLRTPFYVAMRTLTTHDPFDVVTSKIDNFQLGPFKSKQIGNYIKSMHYVDSAIGKFLQDLSTAGLLKNTVIIVYGDHRARLPEKELPLIDVLDQNEIQKVPVIISNSQWKINTSDDTIGGLIDLAPTISNILGIDYSDKVFFGNDLASQKNGYVIFRDGTFISQTEQMNSKLAQMELMASDLIVEKDCISLLKKHPRDSKKYRFSADH